MASNGVIKLPIPNPTTVAVAPERIATMNTATKNTGRFYRRQVGGLGAGRLEQFYRIPVGILVPKNNHSSTWTPW